MRTSRLAVVAAFGVISLIGAACANDTDTGGPGGGGGSNPQAVCNEDEFGCVTYQAGQPIKLGTLMAISGDVAFLGTDSQHGVELAVDNLDGSLDGTEGQLLGHPVTLQNEDDLCSAEGGQSGGTKLASDPTILAVIGTSCSSSALGVADKIFSDKGILLISPSNTNPNLTAEGSHQPFYLRTAHNDKIQGAIVADFAYDELGARTAATIHDESPYADALAAVFRENFEAKGGTITSSEAIQSSDKDFKPLLTSIAQGKPDFLYSPNFDPACALIAKQMNDIAGLEETDFAGSDGCLEKAFIDTGGAAVDGAYASGPDLSGFQEGEFYQNEFLPAYEEQFGSKPTSTFHAHAFDATNILFEAIKKVAIQSGGSLIIPRTALKDAIFQTNGYQGLTGTITCTPLGDCATDVTIGVYQAPDFPCCADDAKPVFSETKTLADIGG